METVEAAHEKFVKKFALLDQMVGRLQELKVDAKMIRVVMTDCERAAGDYYHVSTCILTRYYAGEDNQEIAERYKSVIDSRNINNTIDMLVGRVVATVNNGFDDSEVADSTIRKKRKVKNAVMDNNLARLVETIGQVQIYGRKVTIDNKCSCGGNYEVFPEQSQKICEVCGVVKDIKGVVFRNDHCYPQETQRQKHSGYDTSRHYTFWITRLQAIEKRIFDSDVLDKLRAVIRSYGYTTSDLTCEKMREILKRAKMNCESLNEHVPLLIKTFGGPAPPILTPQENRILHTRFSKAMLLYTIVNPASRNKPYYPYYIGQLLAEMFKDNPEKRRLLNYIHLQSADTVRKNNEFYQQMCALADPSDGMAYHFVGWGAQSWTL